MSQADPVSLLCDLVATPSLSGSEEAAATLVVRWAEEHGLGVERAGPNVLITVHGRANGGRSERRLLLNSHLDTVAPVAGWTTDPYVPRREGDRVIGLGANDAKGCVTALLCATHHAAQQADRWSGEAILALTVEEETGGKGMEGLIGQLGGFDGAVIGEPTGLAICRAQKGLVILEITTSGTARHAAHAHRLPGKNAVVEAARAVTALDGWRPWPAHPLLGPVTVEVTKIDGGTRSNVIPDRCVVTVDVRTTPGLTPDEVAAAVRERTGAPVTVRSGRLMPVETDAGAEIVRAAQTTRPESPVVGSATLSDAVWTRHVPTIKVGPGETERSHTAGEFVTIAELEAGVAFYRSLIGRFLGERG